MRLFALLAICVLFGTAAAYTTFTAPAYGGQSKSCVQLNLSYVSCVDGRPVGISLAISAPYSQIYGNFTVMSADPTNISQPLDIFGNICTVKNGNTNTCFVTIAPYPIFSGNATVNQIVKLKLVPQSFTQAPIYINAFITVQHYLNATESIAIASYASALSQYTTRDTFYNYACKDYLICNSSISGTLTQVNDSLDKASGGLNAANPAAAYYNISAAQTQLSLINQSYANFYAYASPIISNIANGDSNLRKVTSAYPLNFTTLEKCNYSGGTGSNAATYINNNINSANNERSSSSLQASANYLSLTKGLLYNSTAIISNCKSSGTYSPSAFTNLGIDLSGFSLGGSDTEYIVAGIVIVIAIIYIRSRIVNSMEMKRIRKENGENGDGSEKTKGSDDSGDAPDKVQDEDDDYVQKISKKDKYE